MPEELVFLTTKTLKDKQPGQVFGLEGRAQLGPYDSRSTTTIIRFWDGSATKPLMLAARFGLSPDIESALASLEPVRARFKINARSGLNVVACQLPAEGKSWGAWQDV